MRRKIYVFAVVSALALVGSACAEDRDTGFPPKVEETPGSTESPDEQPTDGQTGPAELEGPIDVAAGNVFDPASARVKVGTTVVWEQSDTTQPHTVTASDGTWDSHPKCKSFSDPCMQAGDSFRHRFTKAGEVKYFCRLHGSAAGVGMAGTILVEA